MEKWKCNKCGSETTIKPLHRNSTCSNCGKERYKRVKVCACGKEFYPNHYAQKFCSIECRNKYTERGGKKGKHYPHTQRARLAVCIVCGKEFRAVKDYKGREAKYCSKDCWAHRGSKRKKYTIPPEYREWKKQVLARDNYTCQKCGAKNHLEVHHIKEKTNYPELIYDINNGVCLCHDCHIQTENYGYKARKKKQTLLLNVGKH